jgi:hypothetical protein
MSTRTGPPLFGLSDLRFVSEDLGLADAAGEALAADFGCADRQHASHPINEPYDLRIGASAEIICWA